MSGRTQTPKEGPKKGFDRVIDIVLWGAAIGALFLLLRRFEVI